MIYKTINDSVQKAVLQHISNSYHIRPEDLDVYLEEYVKKSDSDKISDNKEYVTVAALNEALNALKTKRNKITEEDCIYTSHGPTLSEDVGFVYRGRELPTQISYQDLFDIIFYDSKVELVVTPEYVE
ncbi:MAG: hypothetical protein Nk1A_8950 [Endomicrobiia bacterium]|nr:MAG: hypothetical protein Nk1A_8950 [Endomicrobiia bacterium]